MGCCSSTSNIKNSTREIKKTLTLTQRLIICIQQGNLRRFKELISNCSPEDLDMTAVQGHLGNLEIDEMTFQTGSWGPALLSLLFNQMEIFKYLIEEMKLNLAVYLIKPMTQEEFQYSLQIRRVNDPLDKKELTRFKNKLTRYNRIISIVIACKHQNLEMLEYLIENINMRKFWRRKDFYAMLHFVSHNLQIWQFAIPVILRSQIAKRWFYSENETNKSDVFYRLQRQFSIKILLEEMFFTLQQQLSKHPYSAAFFISLANQEFIDDKVPELSCLRSCLQNIKQYDFTMINEEINYFPELKDQILKRFDHVTSYKEIVTNYCKLIDQYNENQYKINQQLDEITTIIMRQDIRQLENKLMEMRVENVTQVQLRVQVSDHRFINSNMLTCALLNGKAKVVEYFLDNDMIDITTCCQKSTSTFNAQVIKDQFTPSQLTSPHLEKSTKEWTNELEQTRQKMTFGSTSSNYNKTLEVTHSQYQDTKGTSGVFTKIDLLGATKNDFYNSNYFAQQPNQIKESMLKITKKKRNFTLPLEILIKQKEKELFLKLWSKFIYQFEYSDFNRLILLINTELRSEDWYKSFLDHQATKEFFLSLTLAEQLDFIDKILIAFDLQTSQTSDVQVFDLLESVRQQTKDVDFNDSVSPFTSQVQQQSDNYISLNNLKILQMEKNSRPQSRTQLLNEIQNKEQNRSAMTNYGPSDTQNFPINKYQSNYQNGAPLAHLKPQLKTSQNQLQLYNIQNNSSSQNSLSSTLNPNQLNFKQPVNTLQVASTAYKQNLMNPKIQNIPNIVTNMNIDTVVQNQPIQHSPGVIPNSSTHQLFFSDPLFDPQKTEQNLNTLHLLKPCTYEIIKKEPYVQIVFLNSFIKFKKDKRLLEHLKIGYSLINYRQKLELYEEYEEKLQNVGFQIFKEQHLNANGLHHAYTITVTPQTEMQHLQSHSKLLMQPLLLKAHKSEKSTYTAVTPHDESIIQMDVGEQIEKVYENFYNHISSKEFLLPHHKNFLNMDTIEL